MHLQYGMGLVLAVVLSVSGCCCPMTCSPMMNCCPQPCCPQTSWTEHLEDIYCDFSDRMHQQSCRLQHQACHLQQKMSCSMRQLAAELSPTPSYQGQNQYQEMPVSAKVPPASEYRERTARRPRGGRCQRCKQSPCRCGYCEGCDGFEQGGPYETTTSNPGHDQYQDQYHPAAADQPLPNQYLPTPTAPQLNEPVPVPPVPAPGPTPIYKAQPPAPMSTSATTPRTITNVGAVQTTAQPTVTPIETSAPVDESLQLRPISFTTHAPLSAGSHVKNGTWIPVPSASGPAK